MIQTALAPGGIGGCELDEFFECSRRLAQIAEEQNDAPGALRVDGEGAAVEGVRLGAAKGGGDGGEPAVLLLAAGDPLRALQPELGRERRQAGVAAAALLEPVTMVLSTSATSLISSITGASYFISTVASLSVAIAVSPPPGAARLA